MSLRINCFSSLIIISQAITACSVGVKGCVKREDPPSERLLETARKSIEATSPTGRHYRMEDILFNRRVDYYYCEQSWKLVVFPDADPNDNIIGFGVAEVYVVDLASGKAAGPFSYVPH